MHTPRPWWRKSEKSYYVQLGKQQYRLGPEKEKAEARFRELLLLDLGPVSAVPKSCTIRQLCKLFLRWSRRNHAPRTREWYLLFLRSFCRLYGSRKARDLKPLHIDVWVERNPKWGVATCRCAIISIKRVTSWATKRKLLACDPLKDVAKPPSQRRERVLTPEEHDRLFAAIKDQAFRDFVFAMRETGCRPGEIMGVTSADVSADGGKWVLSKHKNKAKTGKVRVIYLTPAMQNLTRRLVALNPLGPIFRMHSAVPAKVRAEEVAGKPPWTANAIRCRFRRLREKLGLKGVVAYTYRSSYTTDGLVRGVPAAVLAELQGNSIAMIERHYAHLTPKADLLAEAAIQAVTPVPNRLESRIRAETLPGALRECG